MKKIIILILLLKLSICKAQNDNVLQQMQIASDVDCLINFEHKISKKEQKKIRETLTGIALKTTEKAAIYPAFLSVFPKLKLDKNTLENGCVINRLYENKQTLLTYIDASFKASNVNTASLITENQKQILTTLLELRTFFCLKYAYFDEKKTVFNERWKQSVDNVLASKETDETKAILLIVNALDDPHVNYKVKNKSDMPYIIKGKMVYVFPFLFDVSNNEIFVRKQQNSTIKWSNDNNQIENGMKILEINGLSARKWLDSVERKDGPFFQKRDFMLSNLLYLYYLYEKPATFKFLNESGKTFDLTIERIPIAKKDYAQIFQSGWSKKTDSRSQRPHFHYIKYYEQSNKTLTAFFKSVQLNDTIVFDFRGYPTRQVTDATVLLLGTEEKKVSYSLLRNPKNGCFDVQEESSAFSTKNTALKQALKDKKLVLYGIISGETGSYVETVALTYKTYLPDFQLVGEPSAGAWGTIEYETIGDNGEVVYPYHKFDFYNKSQLNDRNLIVPDIPLTPEEIEQFMNYGLLKKR